MTSSPVCQASAAWAYGGCRTGLAMTRLVLVPLAAKAALGPAVPSRSRLAKIGSGGSSSAGMETATDETEGGGQGMCRLSTDAA